MKANWIGPVRRSRRKYAGQRIARVRARTNLEDVTPCVVKPRQDHDIDTGYNPFDPLRGGRTYIEPCVRCTFPALLRCSFSRFERGSDHANWMHQSPSASLHNRPPNPPAIE